MPDRDLILEIGTEEIPARFLPPAVRRLEETAKKVMADHRIQSASVTAHATPCRLVLHIKDIAAAAETRTVEKSGPPWEASFDKENKPTPALMGFLKSVGAAEKDVLQVDKKGRKFAGVSLIEEGRPARDILREALPGIISSIHFPKNMRWISGSPSAFARPVRNLLCVLHGKPIPFEAFGLTAGNRTAGNKFLAPAEFKVSSAADYFCRMEKSYVIIESSRRRSKILKEAAAILKKQELEAEMADDLVDEVAHLTEYPTALIGDFAPDFLEIPGIILRSAMTHHQRYFPVADAGGNLSPHFLVVRNGPADPKKIVSRGNARVLAARFSDAKYFFETDRKKRLADRIDGLKGVVYLEGLGSLHDRARRIQSLLLMMPPRIGLEIDLRPFDNAGFLCKADLLTEVVREFPELQGAMGRIYAQQEGLPAALSDAIFEHYQPRGAVDPVPASPIGALLALADKFELLLGAFSVGLRPSASADPYGLRRAAIGLARILLARAWHLPIARFIDEASVVFPDPDALRKAAPDILEFFRGRLDAQLKESHPAEFVSACLRVSDDPCEVAGKVAAFDKVSAEGKSKWVTLLRTAKRAHNIVKAESNLRDPEPELFQQDEERDLHQAFQTWRDRVGSISERKYTDRLRAILDMAEPLHRFFEKVFVMVEDPAVRANRLALIKSISDAFRSFAEFDKIAVND